MKFKVLLIIAGMLLLLNGCSVSRVFSGPDPVATEKVTVGQSRYSIISVLGVPRTSETKNDQKTDIYEFVDGYPAVSKVRAVFYIAGDIFTLGLAELLFWPIELAAGQGTAGRAIVTYGMDDVAKSILLTKADGSPWVHSSQRLSP
ncbi:MAG: hypothetical protein Fur0034_06260 [Desulfuromonadia bacterium]